MNDIYSTAEMKTSSEPLSVEQCAAQVALFYLAGSDPTAFNLFELSRKPDLQKRLQHEIDNDQQNTIMSSRMKVSMTCHFWNCV